MISEEEYQLLCAARVEQKAAVEMLFLQYQPLLKSMAVRYYSLADDTAECDDFLQEANIAFLQAVRTYDLSQTEVTFGLYAKVCIRNRLVSKLRSWTNHRAVASGTAESLPDPAEDVVDRENYKSLLNRIACLLSKREMDVFRLYLLGKSYTEISKSLGITEKSVDNALFRMKAKLKKAGISYR